MIGPERLDWTARADRLHALSQRQLFFVGGAPRSGTTWLQQLLDSHPEVSCHGEGLFWKQLAVPLDAMIAARRQALDVKNVELFSHTGGYPLPDADDADMLLGTAILLAMHRQQADRSCRAVGEKTPENVFLFPRLQRLFPSAKFIGIARDPRDVLSSAWHMFHKPVVGEDERAAKLAFIRNALPPINEGARAMLAMRRQEPRRCFIVTYEQMNTAPAESAAHLFRFLGVSEDPVTLEACVDRTSFRALSGRTQGDTRDGVFLRKGIVGDWTATFTAEMNDIILRDLQWMFHEFGWAP